MPQDALRDLVAQAADFAEPSVTSGSVKEIAWLPSDDGLDINDL